MRGAWTVRELTSIDAVVVVWARRWHCGYEVAVGGDRRSRGRFGTIACRPEDAG